MIGHGTGGTTEEEWPRLGSDAVEQSGYVITPYVFLVKECLTIMSNFTVPGLSEGNAKQVIDILQERLTAYNDLHLILKHAHWNVVGPNFIAVHEMIDPEVDAIRANADEVAERIAALGGEAIGTPDSHAPGRDPLQYPVNKGTTIEHIAALDEVYSKVITDSRLADEAFGTLDPVTQDMFTSQIGAMEKFQWFLRAHLEDGKGNIPGGQ